MKAVVIAGLGNPLMTDDGVGVRIVQTLSRHKEEFPAIDFRDIGLSVHGVIHAIANRRAAVLVDCAFMGDSPGSIRRFGIAEVVSKHTRSPVDSHGVDLFDIIALSRKLKECPPEVTIFAVEPADVSPGESLSPLLERRFDEYCSIVMNELVSYRSDV